MTALEGAPPPDSLNLLFKPLALDHLFRINVVEWVAGMVHICRMNPAKDLFEDKTQMKKKMQMQYCQINQTNVRVSLTNETTSRSQMTDARTILITYILHVEVLDNDIGHREYCNKFDLGVGHVSVH
jgi:hypothetical protein